MIKESRTLPPKRIYAQANYFDGESSEDIGSYEVNGDGDATGTTFLKSADMKRYGAAFTGSCKR